MGKRLEWARDYLGKSLQKMQKTLEGLPDEDRPPSTSDSTIHRWEHDKLSPPVSYLMFLSRETGRSPEWFIRGDDDHPAAVRLQIIGKVVDGTLDDETLERLAAIERDEGQDPQEAAEQSAEAAEEAESEDGPRTDGGKQETGDGDDS